MSETREHHDKRETWNMYSIAIMCGVFVCFLVAAGFALIYQLHLTQQIADIQQLNRRLVGSTSSNSSLLVECTTPPSARKPPVMHPKADDCYARSQANQAKAISNIRIISIVAAACGAEYPGDIGKTKACTARALDSQGVTGAP